MILPKKILFCLKNLIITNDNVLKINFVKFFLISAKTRFRTRHSLTQRESYPQPCRKMAYFEKYWHHLLSLYGAIYSVSGMYI